MRKIATLFIIMFIGIITSCNDDDPVTIQEDPCAFVFPGPHMGTWNLVNVSGSIAGVNHDFEPGTIKWTFEFCPNTGITVANNNEDESVEDFLESGNYGYSLLANDQVPPACEYFLTVNNIEFDCMEVTGNNMTLTQQVADGYTLKFTR